MSGYIGPIPVPQGIQNKETFTATAGQTTFNTNGYTDGAFISVYLNGVRLVNGTDYTSTNGSDVVLASGANAGDVLDFETFNEFSLASQQFENITTKNPTHEDTDGGRESAISFKGEQSGGEISTLAQIQASHDGTSDDQKGDLIFKTNDGSDNDAPTERLRIDSAGSIIPATLGTDNVHLGEGAGAAIVSGGNENVAIGKDALTANTTGDANTAVGFSALTANTTGVRNTAVGRRALVANTTGNDNDAFGRHALEANTTGSQNVAIGRAALASATTVDNNTAVGYSAGLSVTTGIRNTLIGSETADALTTGQDNTAVGALALSAEVAGHYNTAVGRGALKVQTNSSSSNVYNTAVGYSAGESVTTGSQNTFMGGLAADAITTGSRNTAFGYTALSAATTTVDNTCFGWAAGLSITTGSYNTCLGRSAGDDITTGQINTLVGYAAGGAITTGSGNCIIGNGGGNGAGGVITTGANNTLVGSYEGNSGGVDIRTSSNNVILSDGSQNIVLRSEGTNHRVSIGDTHAFGDTGYGNTKFTVHNGSLNDYTCALVNNNPSANQYGLFIDYQGGAPNVGNNNAFITARDTSATRFVVNSNGSVESATGVYTTTSDQRIKENIVASPSQWDDIKALQVKKFSYIRDELDEPNMIGFIAQDLEAAGMTGLVDERPVERGSDETVKTVKLSIINIKAIKALQEAMAKIETLEAKVAALEAE